MQPNHSATCAYCGKAVTLSKSQKHRVKLGGPIYCDRRCYGDSMSAPVHRNCLVCGEPFITRQSRVDEGFGIYCGKPCSNKARALPEVGRFWALVEQRADNECWLWLAAQDKNGYGLFTRAGGGQIMAHRMAYELKHGPVATKLLIMHQCDNPPCCNPAHLFPGTNADNMADMVAKNRSVRGEAHGKTTLTEQQVREIKRRYAEGRGRGVTQESLASEFGVRPVTIQSITSGRSWGHVT